MTAKQINPEKYHYELVEVDSIPKRATKKSWSKMILTDFIELGIPVCRVNMPNLAPTTIKQMYRHLRVYVRANIDNIGYVNAYLRYINGKPQIYLVNFSIKQSKNVFEELSKISDKI